MDAPFALPLRVEPAESGNGTVYMVLDHADIVVARCTSPVAAAWLARATNWQPSGATALRSVMLDYENIGPIGGPGSGESDPWFQNIERARAALAEVDA